MTKQEAIAAVYEGKLVECTADEYRYGIRAALQESARRWVDANQSQRGVIALNEVKRLDELHDFRDRNISEPPPTGGS